MNTSIKLISLLMLVISITACATPFQESRRWVEEVKLADGRVINVEREEFLGKDIPLVERNTIKFKTEDGKQFRWESCAKPIALDFVGERYVVIGFTSFGFCIGQLDLTRPKGSSGVAAWTVDVNSSYRIKNHETPRSIKPNLVYVGQNAVNVHFVQHTAKRAELRTILGIPWCVELWTPNGDSSKCSTNGNN